MVTVFIKDSFTQHEYASVMKVVKFHGESDESMDFYTFMKTFRDFSDILWHRLIKASEAKTPIHHR